MILVERATTKIASPAQAIEAGIAYVPEDRRRHGIVLEMPVAANTSLASLPAISRWGWISRAGERQLAERYVAQLQIKTPSGVYRGRKALGRQSTEGRPRALACHQTQNSHPGRADARRGCRFEI